LKIKKENEERRMIEKNCYIEEQIKLKDKENLENQRKRENSLKEIQRKKKQEEFLLKIEKILLDIKEKHRKD